MSTCSFCGRDGPPGGLREVAQVSNPVTYAPCCRRRFRCYLAAIGALIRAW
jgi:hypothetical protein